MKRCDKCGAEIADDDLFCSECGANFEAKGNQDNTGNNNAASQKTGMIAEKTVDKIYIKEKPRNNFIALSIISIIVIGLAFFIIKASLSKKVERIDTNNQNNSDVINGNTMTDYPGAICYNKENKEGLQQEEKEVVSEKAKIEKELPLLDENNTTDFEEQKEEIVNEERFDWESVLQGGDKGWLCITDDFVTDLEKHDYFVRFDCRVTLDDGKIYHQYSFGDDEPLYFVGENVNKVWKYYDYGYDLIVGGEAETNNNTEVTSEYLFGDSDSVKLDDDMWLNVWDDVIVMGEKQGLTLPSGKPLSQMVINEIYAKHGYIFKSKELQEFFEKRSWYNPVTNDMSQIDNELNDIEKYNISFLKQAKE